MRLDLIRLASTAVLTAGFALFGGGTAVGSAQPCPDVEVLFARGTGEAPGVGPTGQAFVDALGSRVGPESLNIYPVNYPATDQWATGIDGIRDASARVISTAATCPQTKMVLGGYSQGAAVMGFVTSATVPDGVDPATVPKPLEPEVAEKVAAVVLFGLPNVRAMNFLGEPTVVIGPQYESKTIKLCATDDAICSDGLNFSAHTSYAYDGLIDQGVTFAGDRLGQAPAADASTPTSG